MARILFFCCFITFFLFISCSKDINQKSQTLIDVLNSVDENHISPKSLDSDLVATLVNTYLAELDPNKLFFTKEKKDHFISLSKSLPAELKEGNLSLFYTISNVYYQQIKIAESICNSIMKDKIDLNIDQRLNLNSSNLPYPKNLEELKINWNKRIKYLIINEIINSKTVVQNSLSINQMNEAKNSVQKAINRKFNQLKSKPAPEYLVQFINSFLKIQDGQSEFLSKKEKEKWDIEFTRTFVGVGLRIESKKSYPEILEIIPGGGAWETQKLNEGDLILEIWNDNGNPKNVGSFTTEEVVTLLKGKENTYVNVKVRKQSGEVVTVNIKRAEIKLELASGFKLSEREASAAYIKLPRFYAGGESSAQDIYEELIQINKMGIESLIFDLRNNKGGSSGEAATILSFFLDQGPLLHFKYNDGEIRTREDDDGLALYKGDLIVLVNSKSSSASELVSATLQDYSRALIVGSKNTFGKGSVQRFIEINGGEEEVIQSQLKGNLKLTIGKFYSAAGRSPQFVGVIPDIILPDETFLLETGERAFQFSLAPETIELDPVSQSVNLLVDVEDLKEESEKRLAESYAFKLVSEKAKYLKSKKMNSLIALNYSDFLKQTEKDKQLNAKFDSIFLKNENLVIKKLIEDKEEDNSLSENLKKNIERDPYIYECFKILQDMLI